MRIKSNTLGIQQDKDCMMLAASNNLQKLANPIVIVESVPTNKKMNLNAKKNLCESITQTTKSSATLEAELTLKENNSSGFWNKQASEMSKKLWLPIETDSVDLDLSLLNGSSLNTMLNSWFSMIVKVPHKQNLLQTSYQSSLYFPVGFTDSGNTLTRSRKIRVYPNKTQKKTLFKWFGVARYVYNTTISYLRQPNTKANWKNIKTEIIKNLPEWAKDVPYQIKSIAIRDACQAVTQAKKNFNKTGKLHKVKFRTRKMQDFNLYIPKSAVKENGVYVTLLGALNIRETIGDVNYDCRVTLFNNRFFLSKPESTAIKIPENQRNPIVALDPGVRTFQTIYEPAHVFKVGQKDFARIYRLCYQLDELYSKRKRCSTNKYNIKLKRLKWKIKDLITEIHHKLALFLVRNFDTILLPSFETSNMVTKLCSKVSRSMLGWSHFAFKTFLKFKAKEYSSNVIDVNEAYTTKTCGNCGRINSVGSKEIFSCKCGIKIDRDLNGARNIFLKNISLAL